MSFKWDIRFLKMALDISNWSKDPSTKVGAVCVDDSRRIITTGYNGFPMGAKDLPDRLITRGIKYQYILHAEENAILSARRSVEGCTMYITHPPCLLCCGRMKQAGICKIVWIAPDENFLQRWDKEATIAYLRELDITGVEYDRSEISS